ncbi:MAG: hypothetical protein NWR72_00160 [Bacteroidia bacterium]|nr:hypothetical protein [Bacteroidia bacterium]
MARRPLKKVEKIILMGFGLLSVMMMGLWILDKEPNRAYYLPAGYEGWVAIRYSVPDADPIENKDGVLQFVISDSGYMETSDPLVVGWRRDEYFWNLPDGSIEPIPSSVVKDGEYHIHVHQHAYFSKDWTPLLHKLAVGTDTVLADRTRLTKNSEVDVDYVTGKKTLEYFYVTAQPQSIMFTPPENPQGEGLESTEDRRIDTP